VSGPAKARNCGQGLGALLTRRNFALGAIAAGWAGRAFARPASRTIRVVGYNDMDEMMAALVAAYRRHDPASEFVLDLKSTRSAPPALLSGAADLAPMGAEMEPPDQLAIARRWGREPAVFALAHASLEPRALSSPTGFYVAEQNPLREIRIDQLARIFGAATPGTWGELGGDRAAPLHLYGLDETTAISRFLQRKLGIAAGFPREMRRFFQSRDAAAAMALDPLALGFANLNHARPGLRALALVDAQGRRWAPDLATVRAGDYPLDRFLLLYARRQGDGGIEPGLARFIAFALSDKGQAIVASGTKGYLPLSRSERRRERQNIMLSRV